jgi:predicted DNA-binding antitoxin AbrB/MazE fold protein
VSITIEAIYEDGVLKPAQPLPLKEHEKVRIRIETAITWAERTAGMMGWKGSTEEAEYFATSPELDFPSPEDEA